VYPCAKTYIPNGQFCHFKAYDVEVGLPNNPTPATISDYQRDIEISNDKADAPLLILSRGSQNGVLGRAIYPDGPKQRVDFLNFLLSPGAVSDVNAHGVDLGLG
jgi:hypothetical protein